MTSVGQPASLRRSVFRTIGLGLLDVAVAALTAVLAFRLIGAWSGDDSNPPVCYNASGGVVSCGLTPAAVMIPVFSVALLALVLWQVRRVRGR